MCRGEHLGRQPDFPITTAAFSASFADYEHVLGSDIDVRRRIGSGSLAIHCFGRDCMIASTMGLPGSTIRLHRALPARTQTANELCRAPRTRVGNNCIAGDLGKNAYQGTPAPVRDNLKGRVVVGRREVGLLKDLVTGRLTEAQLS